LVKKHQTTRLLIGVGIQEEYNAGQHSKNRTLSDLQVRFLQEMSRDSAIVVRGAVSARYCRESGINNCIPLGCPSLTLHKSFNLGSILKSKLEVLQRSILDNKPVRIAIALPAFSQSFKLWNDDRTRLFRFLLNVFVNYNSSIVLQCLYDESNMMQLCAEWALPCETNRITFFTNAEEWMEFLSSFDGFIGSRIHGTMASIAATTPAVIVPTDYRTEELAETMFVPALPVGKIPQETSSQHTLQQFLAEVFDPNNFQSRKFDAHRAKAFKEYGRLIRNIGLMPNF